MPGRPRDLDLEQRLLSAAWLLLIDRGYAALSLSQVASKAGAHRTDVYRRWSSKSHLVSDTLAEHLPPIADSDTGSLQSDLRALLGDLAVAWSAPWVGGLVGWLADLHHDADSEAAFRAMSRRRSLPWLAVIDRAAERGEISAVPDLVAVGNLLEGPLMHRRMFSGQELTPEFLDEIARSACGFLAGPTETEPTGATETTETAVAT